MDMFPLKYAVVRSVPKSYDCCVRTNIEEIDVALARRQHTEYLNALQRLGLEIVQVQCDDSLPDSCFVEDAAVIFEEKAVICNMKVKSRAKETIEVARVLEKWKDTYYIKPPAFIDGGDVLKTEDTVLVGISARTNFQALQQFRETLKDNEQEIIPVKVRNVLHLKSACTYIGNDYVVLSEGHFDASVLQGLNRIVVPEGEEYAADCLAVNGTVLIAKGYPKTKKLIEKEGFRTEELEMSEFRKGEGALTCLSIIW